MSIFESFSFKNVSFTSSLTNLIFLSLLTSINITNALQVLNTQMEMVARRKMGEMRWERNSRKRSRGEQDDEESDQKLYIGSEIFLKGTQSANPHNDYQQHFVDTG